MVDTLSGLMNLHYIAVDRGDGLDPKLLELARRGQLSDPARIVTLSVDQAGAGPQHQSATVTQLAEAGIPSLQDVRRRRHREVLAKQRQSK